MMFLPPPVASVILLEDGKYGVPQGVRPSTPLDDAARVDPQRHNIFREDGAHLFHVVVSLALLLQLSACGGSGVSSTQGTPTLSSIAVTSALSIVSAGQTLQFAAEATYSDNSTKDVTSTANWASSSATIATIAQGGLATGLATGITTISASVSGVTGMTQMTVNIPVPTSWTPMGVDYGLKKQCIRTVSPTQSNFYYDDVDCPGPSYPTSAYWTTAVETEISTGLCVGALDQSLPINTAGSPVSEAWTGNSTTGYSVELEISYTDIANPCPPTTWSWVPLMDNWVGGGPLPAPSHLVTQFNATFNRNLPGGSGATRALAGAVAQWNVAANGTSVLATFDVEVNFYTDQPEWGVQAGQPPDVIAFRANTSANPPSYYVDLDGSKLLAPISAQLSAETLITVNWAAVFQHVVDEGLLPAPINGWNNSNAATTATYAATEIANLMSDSGGPLADLVVSNYEEGSF